LEVNKKMKTWKIITITTTVAILAAAALASTALAMGPWGIGSYGDNSYGYGGMMGRFAGGMMGGYYGGGMMNGYGYGYTSSGTATSPYYQPVYPFMFGGGCFGGLGFNGYTNTPYTHPGTELNITTATQIGQNYVASLNNPDLAVKEIEEYQYNFYIQVYEKSTGIGAFELLVNKYTGSIYPEMGPNMMWNTKYGMMQSGILGGIYGTPTANLQVTETQAGANAQQWLNANIQGATVGEIFSFYGYYHVMAMVNGANYGMMSVNGYTGQVWYHTWHGTFIQDIELS
jgi:hypothetical protein